MKKTLTLLSLLIAFASVAQVPNYVPTNGLVGYWPFNGNANDESGNGNNGTVNGATLTTDRFGVADKAYSFDGVNDLIQINAQTTIAPQSDYSVSFWFNSPISTYNGAFISMGSWFCKLGHDNPGLFYKDEIGNQANNWYEQAHFLTEPTINNWHTIVLRKANNNVDLFLDSVFIGNMTTYGFSNFNSSSLIQLGYYCCQEFYLGQLDDIGVWNRALTQQEITDLYNGCQLGISLQPVDQSVALSSSSTAQFNVSSMGTAYQWQTNLGLGFQNLSNAGQYSGVTTNALTVNNLSVSNNNQQFRCIVSDASCSDTSSVAVLTVIDDLGLTEATTVVSVSPNPSQELFTITATSPLFDAYILYDPQGRKVLEGALTGTTTVVNLTSVSKGHYLLRVTGANAPVHLVKE
jgi:hypothetical protein